MLPEEVRQEIERGPRLVGDNSDGKMTGFLERISLLAMRHSALECARICDTSAAKSEPDDFALDALTGAADDIRAYADIIICKPR